jgi:branched-chain amino acid transport system ATP-binding protein
MPALLGTTWPAMIWITLIFMGGCAFMTGQSLARTWRPLWQTIPYALLLGLADRFLVFALFEGQLLSIAGYLADGTFLVAVAVATYRATRARMMVTQYPWLYQRDGLFGWREKS